MTVFTWNGDKDTVLSPRDSIMYYKGLYQVGMMSVEPQTGHVKAWVGGNDYQYFKYDHVKQGKRQVGSTFKPFVYASAILEKNYSPCMEVPNAKICIEKGEFGLIEDWCPSILMINTAVQKLKTCLSKFHEYRDHLPDEAGRATSCY